MENKYSKIVRLMKYICLFSLFLILIFFIISGIFFENKSKISLDPIDSLNVSDIEKAPSQMTNPKFFGFSQKKEPYSIYSKKVHWYKKGYYHLENVRSDITLNNKDWFFLISQNGIFHETQHQLSLSNQVNLFYNYDYNLSSSEMKINLKNFETHSDEPTQIKGKKFLIKGDKFNFNAENLISQFNENIYAKFYDKDTTLQVNANKLTTYHRKNKAIFEDDVIAKKANIKLNSDILEIFYHQSEVRTKNNNFVVKKIIAKQNVHLQDGKIDVKSDMAVYNENNNKIIMTGNVEFMQNKALVKGNKLLYDLKSQTAKMTSKSAEKSKIKNNERTKIIIKN